MAKSVTLPRQQSSVLLFTNSVGSIPHGSSIDVPLNYADYYFLESLLRKRKIEEGIAPVE